MVSDAAACNAPYAAAEETEQSDLQACATVQTEGMLQQDHMLQLLLLC
jgi:hypothetical protein